MALPFLIGRPLRWLLEPRASSGWRRSLPLAFWDALAAIRARPLPTGFRETGDDPPEEVWSPAAFRRHLTTNLLPFWAKHAPDRVRGGFITHLDRAGAPWDAERRAPAMQARLVYAFAAGERADPGQGYGDLARHGATFLMTACRDAAHGGWHQAVAPDGAVLDIRKRSFDQAYALVGLAEYAAVSGDAAATEMTVRGWDEMERHAWDPVHRGYRDTFGPDWRVESDRKSVCVQLDMLRAALGLFALTREPRYRERAIDLGALIAGSLVDPRHGCALENCRADWRYAPVDSRDRTLSGHSLKAAWLLLKLHRLAPDPARLRSAAALVEFCLRHAWDARSDGFYHVNFRGGAVASGEKLWWAQAEGLNALRELHALTGEPRYRHAFRRQAAFVFGTFADPVHGEWYASVGPDGVPLDDRKGGASKSAYHTVQACLEAAGG